MKRALQGAALAALVAALIVIHDKTRTSPGDRATFTPTAAALAHECDGAGELPAVAGPQRAAAAVLCLLNLERRRHGLTALSEDPALTRAAIVHAADMVARHYFTHLAPEGNGPADRIRAAGYANARLTGENLAWGHGWAAAPAAIVDGWMHSPGHRENILRSGFAEIGIGIVPAPVSASPSADGATYDTTFGARQTR